MKFYLTELNYIHFDFAKNFNSDQEKAIEPYLKVVKFLQQNIPSISYNAGHDLNFKKLKFSFNKNTFNKRSFNWSRSSL